MKRDADKIQFESRNEVEKMLEIIEKYIDVYPKQKDNNILKEFYNLLDMMDIEW